MNQVKMSLDIFKKLLEKGEVNRENDRELFLECRNPEVRSMLSQFEEQLDFSLVETAGAFYFVPDVENNLLGFTTKDLREWVSSYARLADAFLLCYISMFMLYLFYGGKNKNPKQREFLRIADFVEELDARFGKVISNQEQMAELEERYAVNFVRIAELWDSKKDFEENSRKTKVAEIIKTCRLLEREKLVRIIDDKEIRTTRKLDDLMLHYYLNESRVAEMNLLFNGKDDANA